MNGAELRSLSMKRNGLLEGNQIQALNLVLSFWTEA